MTTITGLYDDLWSNDSIEEIKKIIGLETIETIFRSTLNNIEKMKISPLYVVAYNDSISKCHRIFEFWTFFVLFYWIVRTLVNWNFSLQSMIRSF